MKIFRSFLIPKNFKQSVLAIGNFDGLHLGHRKVIDTAKKIAIKFEKRVGVMTFEPHPKCFFGKRFNFFRLTPFRMKYELLKELKIDFLLNIKFDKKIMQLSAKDFIEKILITDLNINHVVTGFDFVFGNKQTGNVSLLKEYCRLSKKLNFTEIAEEKINGSEISSSLTREFLRNGEIEKANLILSRKWSIISNVFHGEKKARQIGYRTANLKINSYCDIRYGVYAVEIEFPANKSARKYVGIANYGVKPTFDKNEPILEVHIFNFSENIYGKKIKISFLKFIREEKKFESVEKLKDQIIKDINLVKKNEFF